jgi:hypothetical protein
VHRKELERAYDGQQIFTRAIGDLSGTAARQISQPEAAASKESL